MEESEARLENIVQQLRVRGYRLTPQRMAILRAVVNSRSHPTAGKIYQQVSVDFDTISLATVYKTLNVMKSLGEVVELKVDGCSHYDNNVKPHPHLICVRCHCIMDLPSETMPGMIEEALDAVGFCALWRDVRIYGLCLNCQGRKKEAVEPIVNPCLSQTI
ncbi:MAG: Fur family transcriptional regulator [Chloroflexota bacterium]|nr:Fur family transcriptional regulator [Chloroflexota bacterium]